MRVGEPGLGELELVSLQVHARDERLFVAIAEMLGHGRRRIVGRGDPDALEQDPEGYLLARAEPHAVPRRQHRVPADPDGFVPLHQTERDVLQRQVERHHLHEARGRVRLVGILRVDHLAIGVEEQDGFGAEGRRTAVQRGRSGGDQDGEAECGQCE